MRKTNIIKNLGLRSTQTLLFYGWRNYREAVIWSFQGILVLAGSTSYWLSASLRLLAPSALSGRFSWGNYRFRENRISGEGWYPTVLGVAPVSRYRCENSRFCRFSRPPKN